MSIHIVLYEPEIPQNTGNIMRTCVAFNCILHLIEPLGFQLDENHVRRSGMDYRKDLVYYTHANWEAFTSAFPAEYVYVTRYGKKTPDAFILSATDQDLFIIFGKESTGIPKTLLREHLSQCMRLPMVGSARSLNLSNCVAIVAYEAIRQQNYAGLIQHETLKGEDWLEQ